MDKAINRNHMISTRVTEGVFQQAEANLKPWGLSVSEFMRLEMGALANGKIDVQLILKK